MSGKFPEFVRKISGKCPGHVRELAGKFPGNFLENSKKWSGESSRTFPETFQNFSGKKTYGDFRQMSRISPNPTNSDKIQRTIIDADEMPITFCKIRKYHRKYATWTPNCNFSTWSAPEACQSSRSRKKLQNKPLVTIYSPYRNFRMYYYAYDISGPGVLIHAKKHIYAY